MISASFLALSLAANSYIPFTSSFLLLGSVSIGWFCWYCCQCPGDSMQQQRQVVVIPNQERCVRVYGVEGMQRVDHRAIAGALQLAGETVSYPAKNRPVASAKRVSFLAKPEWP